MPLWRSPLVGEARDLEELSFVLEALNQIRINPETTLTIIYDRVVAPCCPQTLNNLYELTRAPVTIFLGGQLYSVIFFSTGGSHDVPACTSVAENIERCKL